MSFQTIIVRKEAPVAEVILNRPEVLNAMNATMDEELYKALWELRQDKTVKAVVIRGSGRAFTSGQDVREFAEAYSTGRTPDFKLGLQRRKRVSN
ncbi:MAG: enoyl-CoA hydratase/isomerase family protein [Candidatus Bathyarchaeia archaeon]